MHYETIAYEVADGIATITLDRPDQLNALDSAMERELLYVWDRVDADDDVRAVVVTGRGRAFCAGFDLSEGGGGFDVFERARLRGTEDLRPGDIPRDCGGLITLRIFRCLKPVIAAINGAGVGFGATFPLPMDVRIASTTAQLGLRLQPARDVHGRRVELVPAPRGRDDDGDGVGAERSDLRRRGGARARARPRPARAGRAAGRGVRARPSDHRRRRRPSRSRSTASCCGRWPARRTRWTRTGWSRSTSPSAARRATHARAPTPSSRSARRRSRSA